MSNEPSVTFQGTALEARKDTVSGAQVVKAAQVTQIPPPYFPSSTLHAD